MGISPKNGRLNVAIPSSVDKVSLVFGRLLGIGGGCIPCTSSFEGDASSEEDAWSSPSPDCTCSREGRRIGSRYGTSATGG